MQLFFLEFLSQLVIIKRDFVNMRKDGFIGILSLKRSWEERVGWVRCVQDEGLDVSLHKSSQIFIISFILSHDAGLNRRHDLQYYQNKSSFSSNSCPNNLTFWLGSKSNRLYTLEMQDRDYTPTKTSKILSNTGNSQPPAKIGDYTQRPGSDLTLLKEYETLKLQVKQLQGQNRQLSTEAQKLRYEKNIHENKYMQKVSFEGETLSQFQKEKNYQLELIKIRNDEEVNKVRREFDLRADEVQREIKGRDYQTREFNEKNAYLELKANELKKGVENLEGELLKYRENNLAITDRLAQEEYGKNKLQILTDELDRQKCEMQAQIHVLLDIQAEKSRNINSLQVQLRNSEAKERSLHEKIGMLTDNFGSLEEHISLMKERLISADLRNDKLEKELEVAELKLADCDANVNELKEFEIRFRKELERHQMREVRGQKELNELIMENERLFGELNLNRQKLHQICIAQGIAA